MREVIEFDNGFAVGVRILNYAYETDRNFPAAECTLLQGNTLAVVHTPPETTFASPPGRLLGGDVDDILMEVMAYPPDMATERGIYGQME